MERREALKKMSLAMGGALSATTLTAVLSQCSSKKSEELVSGTSIFKSQDLQTISRISDRIIPATDTPGALDAKVPEWIELMLNDCYDKSNQQKFKSGMEKFRGKISKKHQVDLAAIGNEPLEEFLTQYELEVYRDNSRDEESFFMRTVKELTLIGYFSSEAGATQALKYIPVPAKYEPCTTMKEEKAWATS